MKFWEMLFFIFFYPIALAAVILYVAFGPKGPAFGHRGVMFAKSKPRA